MSNVTDFGAAQRKKAEQGGPTSAVVKVAQALGIDAPDHLVGSATSSGSGSGEDESPGTPYWEMVDWDATALTAFSFALSGYYEFFVANGCTPYVHVDVNVCRYLGHPLPDWLVETYAPSGILTMSLAPIAVRNLTFDLPMVSLDARFNGQNLHMVLPAVAILAIYEHQNPTNNVQRVLIQRDPNSEVEDSDDAS